MFLSPLEEAVLNAQEVAAGLAAMALVQDLIDKGDKASETSEDRGLDIIERKKALKDHKHINMLLNLIAEQRSLVGINA
jgi:hypothetical protein|tara:strand:- start:1290 stop:1526 length:237 start_codon:yes stop_codon:yes gene_type:complete